MTRTIFLVIVLLVFSTKLQASPANLNPRPNINASQEPLQEKREHFLDTQSFLKSYQDSVAAFSLKACDCPPRNVLAHPGYVPSLDCSPRLVSSAWHPSVKIMPKKPVGFYFNLNLNDTSSNDAWCQSGTFSLLNVTQSGANQNFPTILDTNGVLQISSARKINKSEYCVIRKKHVTIFKICVEDPSNSSGLPSPSPPPKEGNESIKKCCPHDHVMDGNNLQKCVKITNQTHWFPIYYRDGHKLHNHGGIVNHPPMMSTPGPNSTHPNGSVTISPACDENRTQIIHGFPSCEAYSIRSFLDNKFPNLQENGDVILVNEKALDPKRKYTTIPAGQFCIDGIHTDNPPPYPSTSSWASSGGGQNNDVSGNKEGWDGFPTYSGSEWHQGMIVCLPIPEEPEVDASSWTLPLYAAVNHTAALFLLLTAIVYILLWSHQNIHGWLQFAYAVSLFFAFSFLAVVQVWSQVFIENWPNLCFNLGWLIHFSILSSFFWLTSMNFDLWWRFSGRRYLFTIRSKPGSENLKKFLLFALFSVGFPVILTGTAVLLDRMFEKYSDADWWIKLPRFGLKKCYFKDKKSQFPFLYLPIGILLLINLLFFSSTVVQLRNIHSGTELARSSSTVEDKKGVRLIAKLFIVMGVLWSFEFLSWAASMAFPDSGEILIWLFMPTEIINSLQGIAIFVIFICKPNVLNRLSAKFGSLRCRQ